MQPEQTWIASWVSSQQLTEPHNLPPAPGLPDSTLRQIVQLSLGGERLRVSFSNLFGNAPLTLKRARLAVSTGGSVIDPASDTALTFGLGTDTGATVQVEWPSGAKQSFPNVPANRKIVIEEGRGIR